MYRHETMMRWRRPLIWLLHMGLAGLIYFLAFWVRFDLDLFHDFYAAFWQTLPIAVAAKVLSFAYFNLHKGLWRYATLNDLWRILQACAVSAILLTVVIAFYPGFRGFPRSVILIDLGLSILIFGGKRFSIRMLREFLEGRRVVDGERRRLLIAGAGAAGIMAMKELKSQMGTPCEIVGFLDDDPYKKSMMLDRHRVLGPLSEVVHWVRVLDVDEILLAMPSAPKRVGRDLVDQCRGLPVKIRSLPSLADLMSGRLQISAIHEVQLEDLLGRDPVVLDRQAVREMMGGSSVLVTGAGGSIGSEISRQVAACGPSCLVLLDMAETPLFHIENELRALYPDLPIRPILADIQREAEIRAIFEDCRPRYVFHAAAYKHVPMLESHPVEAILNNVMGTRNVATAARQVGAAKFLMISTDKAVRPSSIMGATKRCAELMVQSMDAADTAFLVVRFGNVLGSNGSVVPLFRKQIESGGPVTLTHRDVTRFFMTIPEAVELVLQTMRIGRSGDVHILDMGEPIRIYDMARQLIELAGFVPEVDIKIVETGLRPGEKMHEELVSCPEDLVPSEVPNVRLLSRKSDDNAHEVQTALAQLIEVAKARNGSEAINRLWKCNEEYGE